MQTETIADDFAAMIQGLPDGLGADVERELRLGFALELMLAKRRQEKLAAFNHRNPRRALEGIGQTMMSIDPVFRMLAERMYGKGCWGDKGFVREALRDNPDLRVPYKAAKTALRVNGGGINRKERKDHKRECRRLHRCRLGHCWCRRDSNTMRTVTFKSVLYGVAYLIGLDPETNLNANEAASITEYINQSVRLSIESKDWPELTNVEQRTPASGLVAYAQMGQTPIGIVYQVYYHNPATQRFPREHFFWLSSSGIQLSPEAPSSVWVRFGIQPPVFSSDEWSGAGTYAAGAIVYSSVAGDCYVNLTGTNTTTDPSGDATNWSKVLMPYITAEAVKAMVYQLVQREEGQTEKAEVEQKRGLTLLQAAQMQSMGKTGIAGQRRVYDAGSPATTSNAQGGA